MQRHRLLSATVEVAYERGVQALTVATICKRSGVSRKTFYEIFEEREDCLRATFEDAVERAAQVVREALADQGGTVTALGARREGNGKAERVARSARSWCEWVRVGLQALLAFLDREPGIGRLLVVEVLGSGPHTLEARRQALVPVIAFVDEGRAEVRKGQEPPPLTAEGTVGAVLCVIQARMLAGVSLVELTGPLMAMIVQPYLGAAAARRELERPVAGHEEMAPNLPSDPFKDLPIRFTYRTARVLASIAQAPGASSKQIALASGITDDGQASRLLGRLQHHDLIEDNGVGPTRGMARAWTLTPRGEQILQAVGQAAERTPGRPIRSLASRR